MKSIIFANEVVKAISISTLIFNDRGDFTMKRFLLSALVMFSALGCFAQKSICTITHNEGETWEKTFTSEEAMAFDSVVVKGFMSRDIMYEVMLMTNNGKLTGVDLSGCTIEDNTIPTGLFSSNGVNSAAPQRTKFHENEGFVPGRGIVVLEYVTFPESLKKIGRQAFNYCPQLAAIEIPAGVEEIEEYAFISCDNIKKFVVHTSNPDIAKLYSFNCKLGNTTLYVPKGAKEAFAQHEAWNRFGAIVEYDDVNGIGRLESGLGTADGRIYTIDGRYAGTDINALGHGMYIMDGRKVAK